VEKIQELSDKIAKRLKAFPPITIFNEDFRTQGRFTIVWVRGVGEDHTPIDGLGCSHASREDEYKPEVGYAKALSRAVRDLYREATNGKA
jgi:hypothetical protein